MEQTVVERISCLANQKNMTVKQVSVAVGIGENSIYRWNKSTPNVATIKKVADFLNVSVDYLMFGNNENECS